MRPNIDQAATLVEWGERRIVEELILPRFPGGRWAAIANGDDCALLFPPPPGHLLTVTTDPCPVPAVCLLEEPDLYYYGWFTVTINASDLAAMGSTPMGILLSTVMPEGMRVAEYDRFLQGVADASREFQCPVVGGNIKDGPGFTASGTAFGHVQQGWELQRKGATPGDRILVVGDMGLFWSAVISRLDSVPDRILRPHAEVLDRALRRPQARTREGQALGATRCVTSCMDGSDGLGACLAELARANGVDLVISRSLMQPHPAVLAVCTQVGLDPLKAMLAWGDWQLVCTVRRGAEAIVERALREVGAPFAFIGEVEAGAGHTRLFDGPRAFLVPDLASRRFSPSSYFSHGLLAYYTLLRKCRFEKLDAHPPIAALARPLPHLEA